MATTAAVQQVPPSPPPLNRKLVDDSGVSFLAMYAREGASVLGSLASLNPRTVSERCCLTLAA